MYKCKNQTEIAVKMANKLTCQYKVQKSQVTVDTKTLSKQQSMYHTSEWHKLPPSSKVCKSQAK